MGAQPPDRARPLHPGPPARKSQRNMEKKERTIMAYKINDACVSCGTCEGECPVNAIHEGDGKYEIDADTCISCGTCAGACPVGAIEEG